MYMRIKVFDVESYGLIKCMKVLTVKDKELY